MRNIIAILLIFCCVASYARLKSVKITATVGNPIPNSYDIGDPQSAAMTCEGVRHFMAWNETDERIRIHPVKINQTPSDNVTDFIWLPAGSQAAWDFLPIAQGATVFVRSDGAPITDKTVEITCW